MSRFEEADYDVNTLKQKSKCKNTGKSTNVWVKAYEEWRTARSHEEALEETEPEILNKRLEQFFTELRKKNGAEYEPSCLPVMLSALDRHLKDADCKFSLQDRIFYSSREVLNGKAKMLRSQGLGKRPNKADSMSPTEVDMLWDSGHLGIDSPRSLIYTLWWVLNEQCGGRGQDGHNELEIDEFSLATDDSGRDYIKYVEGPRKTRQGGLKFKPRAVFPRMYRTGGQRCPVNIFLLYKSKRPRDLENKGPLYLQVIDNPKDASVWYKTLRMGVNSLGAIVKEIVKGSPLADNGKRYTNHSVRKSTVKKMRSKGIAKEDIRTVTGHKHSDSLDAYDSGDDDVLHHLSTTLSSSSNALSNNKQMVSSSTTDVPSCSKKETAQTVYKEVHGNVYNITVQNCRNVSVPTNAAQAVISPKFKSKRINCIIDSSPEC